LATKAESAKQAATQAWSGAFGEPSAAEAPVNPYSREAQAVPAPTATVSPGGTELPLEGLAVHDLAEVLRFDISPQWVYRHWARKSTALSNLDFYGVRVPLVTGTDVHDVAGSLTYYFGAGGHVERITFRGRTGDARPMIALVMSRYGLRRQRPETPGNLLYEVRWNGRATSRLRISPASVIWASVPHATYAVELDLNRPGAGRYLQESPVNSGPVPTHAPLVKPRAPR
jgi:hypothetical protein